MPKYNGYPLIDNRLSSFVIDSNQGIVQKANLYSENISLTNDIIIEQALLEINTYKKLPFEVFDQSVKDGNLVYEDIYYVIKDNTTIYVDELPDYLLNKKLNFIVLDNFQKEKEITLSFLYLKSDSSGKIDKWSDKLEINVIVVAKDNLLRFNSIFGYIPKSYTETRYFWKDKRAIETYDTTRYSASSSTFNYKDQLNQNPNNQTIFNYRFILCDYIPSIKSFASLKLLKKDRVLINVEGINSKKVINDISIIENNTIPNGFTDTQKVTTIKKSFFNCLIEYNLKKISFTNSEIENYDFTEGGNFPTSKWIDIRTLLIQNSKSKFDKYYDGVNLSTVRDYHQIIVVSPNSTGNGNVTLNTTFNLDGSYRSGSQQVLFRPTTGELYIYPSGNFNTATSIRWIGVAETISNPSIMDIRSFDFTNSTVYFGNESVLGYFLNGNIVIPTSFINCLFRPTKESIGAITITDYSKKVNCYKTDLIIDGTTVANIENIRIPEFRNYHKVQIDSKTYNLDNAILDFGRVNNNVYSKLIAQELGKSTMEFLLNNKDAVAFTGFVLSVEESQIAQVKKKMYTISINSGGFENIRQSNINNDLVFFKRPDIDLIGYYFNKDGVFDSNDNLINTKYAEDFFIIAEDRDNNNKIHIIAIVGNRLVPSIFTDNNKIVFDDGRYHFVSAFQMMQQLTNTITNDKMYFDIIGYDNSRGSGSIQFLDLTHAYSITQFTIL